jgi:hypothetical protein
MSFSALSNCLSSHDGFLFVPEPLYFLLDPDQLLLNRGFIFFSFLVLVSHLDLVKLSITLNHLYCLMWVNPVDLGWTGASVVLLEPTAVVDIVAGSCSWSLRISPKVG